MRRLPRHPGGAATARARPAVLLAVALAAWACAAGTPAARAADPAPALPPAYANPVLPGNYPDPTAVRDGETYWLAATSRGWAPVFPLLRSRDLVRWERVGAVLRAAPRWAAGPFWAPELVRWQGTARVYYTARLRRNVRRPCIGVATAGAPGGPYRDLGRPLLCPRDGAIDPFVAADADGVPHLLYRRFGGSGGIWARRLRPDGLAVAGPPRLLLAVRDEDRGVVEGPAVLRHAGEFVLLYARRNCCRPPCDYEQAAARAPALLGPYRRARAPVLAGSRRLRCPGHGTPVEDAAGGTWLLHHAVLGGDRVNARRHTLLEPLRWGADGWPEIGAGGVPAERAAAPPGRDGAAPTAVAPLLPELAAGPLDPGWEWPWDRPARARQGERSVTLRGDPRGATLARQVVPPSWRARVRVRPGRCAAGIAAVEGDRDAGESIGLELAGRTLRLWRGETGRGPGRTLARAALPGHAPATLTASVRDGRRVRFWAQAGGRRVAVGRWVRTPPKRRVIRLALTCRGPRGAAARLSALRVW